MEVMDGIDDLLEDISTFSFFHIRSKLDVVE
jgi:hypothetical protein